MSRSALISIDVGTSSIKVAAFRPSGETLALERVSTPTHRFVDGRAEHDPEALWQAAAKALRGVCARLPADTKVEAIAPTSVGEAGLAVDGDGRAVHPAIAWYDTRATAEAQWLEAAAGTAAVNRIAGQPIDPHYGVMKLLWLRNHEPSAFAAARQWLSLADYLILRLSGDCVTEPTLASRTLLFDQRRRDWSDELLAVCGINRSLLPAIRGSGERVGELLPEVARLVGLASGTPVATAGHDRLCGAFAARQGAALAVDSVGSAEAVVLPVHDYVERSAEEAQFVSCYADVVPDHYAYSARVGYAGALLDWLTRLLSDSNGGSGDFNTRQIEALEAAIPRPLAPSGLLVYPSFGRVIAPFWSAGTKGGAVLGLTLAHGRGHICQALMEGVCFSLRANLDWLEHLSAGPLTTVRVECGASHGQALLQLKADIVGRPLDVIKIDQPTALGAALLGGIAVGLFQDHRAAAAALSLETERIEPDPERSRAFEPIYREGYRKLPSVLASVSAATMVGTKIDR